MKRKDPPKSPAVSKDTKKSKSPAPEKISIEEQRRRAIEWAEKLKAETKAVIDESIQQPKKTKTPSKSSKSVTVNEEKSAVKSRTTTPVLRESRTKVSTEVIEDAITTIQPSTATKARKTPAKGKKSEIVVNEDTNVEEEPVVLKSTKKVSLTSPPLSTKKVGKSKSSSLSLNPSTTRDSSVHPTSDVWHLIPLEPKSSSSFSFLWFLFYLLIIIAIAGYVIVRNNIDIEIYLPAFLKIGIPSIIVANIIGALRRLHEIFQL